MIDTALAPPPVACSPTPVAALPVVQPVGATAGEPGFFTPPGAAAPATLAALLAIDPDVVASPATAWDEDQYVVLGDNSRATWSGTAWEAWTAP